VQRAPLSLAAGTSSFTMSVFVDGGLIEAFLGGRVITPLVAPDEAAGAPEDRQTTVLVAVAGVKCAAQSWELAY